MENHQLIRHSTKLQQEAHWHIKHQPSNVTAVTMPGLRSGSAYENTKDQLGRRGRIAGNVPGTKANKKPRRSGRNDTDTNEKDPKDKDPSSSDDSG
jgi:hypothetical protein